MRTGAERYAITKGLEGAKSTRASTLNVRLNNKLWEIVGIKK